MINVTISFRNQGEIRATYNCLARECRKASARLEQWELLRDLLLEDEPTGGARDDIEAAEKQIREAREQLESLSVAVNRLGREVNRFATIA